MFEEVVHQVTQDKYDRNELMKPYNFKKYKVEVYDHVLNYFNSTPYAWDLLKFPNIDEFVHKAWDMARNPHELEGVVHTLLSKQMKVDDDYEKSDRKGTVLDPSKHKK